MLQERQGGVGKTRRNRKEVWQEKSPISSRTLTRSSSRASKTSGGNICQVECFDLRWKAMIHFAAAIDRDGEYRVPRARYLPSLTSEQLFDPIDLPFFLWTSSREDEHQV
jgi:hypothetical protein